MLSISFFGLSRFSTMNFYMWYKEKLCFFKKIYLTKSPQAHQQFCHFGLPHSILESIKELVNFTLYLYNIYIIHEYIRYIYLNIFYMYYINTCVYIIPYHSLSWNNYVSLFSLTWLAPTVMAPISLQ